MPFPSHTTTRTALITSRIKFSSALNRIIDSGFGFYSASATWVMGKVKFRKLKSLRHNPVDLPSADELSRVEVAEDSLPDQNAPVLSKLTSNKAEDRIWACYSLANFVFDKSSLDSLVTEGVVVKVTLLLDDKNFSVRESAAGALRNIIIAGGDDVINNDIILPLIGCIKECSVTLEQASCDSGKERQASIMKDECTRVLAQCLQTVWVMSELSQCVIDTINSHEVVPLLVTLLKPTCPPSVIVLAGHCLLTITEDNQTAIQWLSSNQEHLTTLESLLSCDQFTMGTRTLVRSLIIGIFHNIYEGISDQLKQQVLTAIVKELAEVLQHDVSTMIISNTSGTTTELVSEVDNVLLAQQVSLEVITNLCYDQNDDDDDWEDMEEEQVDIGIDNGHTATMQDDESEHLQTVVKLFVEQQIPQKVLEKCAAPQHNLNQFTSSAKIRTDIFNRLCLVLCRALTALRSLSPIVPATCLGDLTALWNSLYSMASGKIVTATDDEFPEAVTAAMWTILDKLNSTGTLQCLTNQQVQWICEVVTSSGSCDPSTMANMIKTMGVASKITAANEQQDQHKSKVILSLFAGALKKCVEASTSLWTCCEAVDVMYDVFGSSVPLATLLSSTGVIPILQQLADTFKQRFKDERRAIEKHPGHIMGLIEMVEDNLTNFIDYLKHPT